MNDSLTIQFPSPQARASFLYWLFRHGEQDYGQATEVNPDTFVPLEFHLTESDCNEATDTLLVTNAE